MARRRFWSVLEDSAARSHSDRADAVLAPLHDEESSRRDVFVLWLIALVFTTAVTALFLLGNGWLR